MMDMKFAQAVVVGVIAGYVYYRFFQKVPVFKVGKPKFVGDTLELLPCQEMTDIIAKGYLTRFQWERIQKRVMKDIDAALGTKNGRGTEAIL